MAAILKGAPVVAAMNEANAARCAALSEKGIIPTLRWSASVHARTIFPTSAAS